MPADSLRMEAQPCGPRARRPRAALFAATALPLLALLWACAHHVPEAVPVVGTGRVSGRIIRVHADDGRIEIADAGQRFSVSYDGQTLIKSGSVELKADDMRKGDRVVISLDDSGEGSARLITIAGPPRPTPAVEATEDEP